LYWTWKSRARKGCRREPRVIRELIRRISLANPHWGAPRIHGELLKIGIEVMELDGAVIGVIRQVPSSFERAAAPNLTLLSWHKIMPAPHVYSGSNSGTHTKSQL
jgi:hypothetical protein